MVFAAPATPALRVITRVARVRRIKYQTVARTILTCFEARHNLESERPGHSRNMPAGTRTQPVTYSWRPG
jgi:hypothetical protein